MIAIILSTVALFVLKHLLVMLLEDRVPMVVEMYVAYALAFLFLKLFI